jgi:hypothetical protein
MIAAVACRERLQPARLHDLVETTTLMRDEVQATLTHTPIGRSIGD